VALVGRHEFEAAVVVPVVVPIHKCTHLFDGNLFESINLIDTGHPMSGWISDYCASASSSRRTWNNRHQGRESFASAQSAKSHQVVQWLTK